MVKKKKVKTPAKATVPRRKKTKTGRKSEPKKGKKPALRRVKKALRKEKKRSVKAVKRRPTKQAPKGRKSPGAQRKKPKAAGPARSKAKAKKTLGKGKARTKADLKRKTKPVTKKVKKLALRKASKTLRRTSPVRKKKSAPLRPRPSARSRSLRRALKQDISTVLVTDAFSGVGISLVQHLLRQGFSVVATDRRSIEIPAAWERKGVILKSGNLADPRFVASLLDGVDAVIHTAAFLDAKPRPKGYVHSTAIRTRVVFHETKKRGVKRFVHIGSGSVYKRMAGSLAEDSPIEARKESQQDQIEAERIVLSEASPGLPLVTVIRSASIYGPRCTSQMASIATLPPLVKTLGPYYLKLSGGPTQNLVHVEDVARASVFVLLHPEACGEVFNLGDNDPMTFGDFVNLAMEIYGLKPLKPRVPYPPSTLLQSILPYVAKDEIFNPLTQLSILLWERMVRKQKLKKALTPRIDQETLSLGPQDIVLDNHKLLSLGFKLKYPKSARGWEKTVQWYINNRWIPQPKNV